MKHKRWVCSKQRETPEAVKKILELPCHDLRHLGAGVRSRSPYSPLQFSHCDFQHYYYLLALPSSWTGSPKALSYPTMSLLGLPAELLIHVIGYLPPSAHLDFALTSRFCAACSRDVLRYHRECAQQYGVISDLSSHTVPSVLRTVISDPMVAWHVRSFESWGMRNSWHDWKEFVIPDAEGRHLDTNAAQHDGTSRDSSFWSTEEYSYFERYLASDICYSATMSHFRSRRDVERGDDTALRVLLAAHCPRLSELSFTDCDEGMSWVRTMGEFRLPLTSPQ